MRVVFVHSFYRDANPSGENIAVRAQVDALRRHGIDAEIVGLSTDDLLDEPLYSARAFLRVATGRGRTPLGRILELQPDLVHVHNTYPNYGRNWVTDLPMPFVATLHNFRPLCAQGCLFRDGEICTLCPDGQRWAGVRHACYHGSRLGTLPTAWHNRRGPMADPVLAGARRLIALSETARQTYAESGLDAARIEVGQNFLLSTLDAPPALWGDRDGWLYVGRISQEKGVIDLIESWPTGHRLRLVGGGPGLERARSIAARRDIDVMGQVSREVAVDQMRRSVGLVLPSQGLEGPPLVYVEALAAGLPVLAFEPSLVAETVRLEKTGVVVRWGDPLGPALDESRQIFQGLREHCREVFQQHYSEAAFVERTRSLYQSVLAEA